MNKIMTLLLVLLAAGCMQAPQADVEGLDKSAITAVLDKQTRSYFQRSYEGEADVWAHQPYIMRMLVTLEPDLRTLEPDVGI
jgi:hypothetical protein